jgi:hypothetical protein
MRAIFGLVAILIFVGVLVWFLYAMYLPYTKTVTTVGRHAQDQAAQIAGIDNQNGGRVSDSIALVADRKNGKLEGILISAINPGSAFQKYFGVMTGDVIVEIETSGSLQKIPEIANGDDELPKDMIVEAYQRKNRLVVLRNGQRLTLPAAPAPAPAPVATQQPAAPAPSKSPLQTQIDTLQKIGAH